MKITRISALTVKAGRTYELSGRGDKSPLLPGGQYLHFRPYRELYGRRTEALLVRVETDAGFVGWGEAQAPVGPEVAQAIVTKVLAPVTLGRDPMQYRVRYAEMYDSMRARGQNAGYQLDALAALDTALWDIVGQVRGVPVAELLGGRFRSTLPCYVTGLLGETIDERIREAQQWRDEGIAAVKPLLGLGAEWDLAELSALRNGLDDGARLAVDVLWRYSRVTIHRLARHLADLGVDFLEAPLPPEDIEGHAALVRDLDVAVAVGEPLRSRYEFLRWLQSSAIGLCQPDLMRNGITETVRIADLASSFHVPVALHNGAVTVVGMAATWQVASTLDNFYIQEIEPQMLDLFNPWLRSPLRLVDGEAQVPLGPGLGIELDEDQVLKDVDSRIDVAL